jgi:hypothetical protein
MRSGVATALVICGTLIALMPSISDFYHGYQVSQFLSDRTVQSGVTVIHQPFGEVFRASAWVLGIAMIGLGSIAGGVVRVPVSRRAPAMDRTFGHDMLVVEAVRRESSARMAS